MTEYTYKCTNKDCLAEFDTREHLDVGSARCPECGKVSLRRVFYPINFLFKGGGFYDKRGKSRLTG